MENIRKVITMVLIMVGVAAYSVYNYVTGQTDLDMLIGSLLILCIPMVNIIAITIRNWRDRE